MFAWFGQNSLDEDEDDSGKFEEFLNKKRTYRLNAWFGQKSLRKDNDEFHRSND